MGNQIKKWLFIFLCVATVAVIVWVICGYYLDNVIHLLFPNLSSENYADYWFYIFSSLEFVFVITTYLLVSKFINKKFNN